MIERTLAGIGLLGHARRCCERVGTGAFALLVPRRDGLLALFFYSGRPSDPGWIHVEGPPETVTTITARLLNGNPPRIH